MLSKIAWTLGKHDGDTPIDRCRFQVQPSHPKANSSQSSPSASPSCIASGADAVCRSPGARSCAVHFSSRALPRCCSHIYQHCPRNTRDVDWTVACWCLKI